MRVTKIVEIWSSSCNIPKSSRKRPQVANDHKSHVVVNGLVIFWLISTSVGIPRQKVHLNVGPVDKCKVYYKGEGGGFPQVRAEVSLVCPCCPWLVLTPKVLQLCTNHLVWVLCRPM